MLGKTQVNQIYLYAPGLLDIVSLSDNKYITGYTKIISENHQKSPRNM